MSYSDTERSMYYPEEYINEEYLTELKNLAFICEFGDLKDSLIKDIMICGLKAETLREKLLQNDVQILDEAIRICITTENARDRNSEITIGNNTETTTTVDYSLYYQNEFNGYAEPKFTSSIPEHRSFQAQKPVVLPTINYLNERKCPIYVHRMRNDSSVYNNYNQKLGTVKKNAETPRVNPQIASKFVLDKLEETYWATWKPKKEFTSPKKVSELGFTDSKPLFRVHNRGSKKTSNKPHGDVNSNIIKYFKAKDFKSSSTAASINQDEISIRKLRSRSTSPLLGDAEREHKNYGTKINTTLFSIVQEKSSRKLPRPRKFEKVTQRDSISQEIQTEVHCPVVLAQMKEELNQTNINYDKPEKKHEENLETITESNEESAKETDILREEENHYKQEEIGKKHQKNTKKSKKGNKKQLEEMPTLTETEDNSESLNTFVEIKDSIELTKERQKNSEPKEHFQQPKCIRLYRKSGGTSGYIKGGSYPLKSCLKKDSFSKGNFRLGAPGSPLFVTTGSFSNRRRK